MAVPKYESRGRVISGVVYVIYCFLGKFERYTGCIFLVDSNVPGTRYGVVDNMRRIGRAVYECPGYLRGGGQRLARPLPVALMFRRGSYCLRRRRLPGSSSWIARILVVALARRWRCILAPQYQAPPIGPYR